MRIFISISAIPDNVFKFWKKSNYIGKVSSYYNRLFQKETGNLKALRVYIPLEHLAGLHQIAPPPAVDHILKSNGYIVDNYLAGYAKKENDNRPRSIGSILNDLIKKEKCTPQVLKEFETDPIREGVTQLKQEHFIVISRDPYDIAGASYDRGWKSCLHLTDGSNKHYLANDVRQDSLIAYLVEKGDEDILSPKARYRILCYKNKDDPKDYILVRQPNIHGTALDSFKHTLDKWLDKINGKKTGLFCVNDNALNAAYNDSGVESYNRKKIYSLGELTTAINEILTSNNVSLKSFDGLDLKLSQDSIRTGLGRAKEQPLLVSTKFFRAIESDVGDILTATELRDSFDIWDGDKRQTAVDERACILLYLANVDKTLVELLAKDSSFGLYFVARNKHAANYIGFGHKKLPEIDLMFNL